MKKTSKTFKFYIMIFIMFAILFFSGCSKSNITNISLHSYIESKEEDILNGEIHTKAGEFDFDDYYILVESIGGVSEKITLEESMVDKNDIFYLYKVGESDVRFYYDNYYIQATVVVELNNFSDEIYFESNSTYEGKPWLTIEYDGNFHGLTLTGALPQGYEVYYKYGNAFDRASDVPYGIEAVLSKDGYKEKVFKGLLLINPHIVEEELSSIVFEDVSYIYDGNIKMNKAEEIPSFLNVTYKYFRTSDGVQLKDVVDAGEYNVELTLASKDPLEPIHAKEQAEREAAQREEELNNQQQEQHKEHQQEQEVINNGLEEEEDFIDNGEEYLESLNKEVSENDFDEYYFEANWLSEADFTGEVVEHNEESREPIEVNEVKNPPQGMNIINVNNEPSLEKQVEQQQEQQQERDERFPE